MVTGSGVKKLQQALPDCRIKPLTCTAEPERRWFHLSPDRFVIGLLLAVGLLWLSERFQWFGFNHHKGWTVLIAVAAVGVAAVMMLPWWAAGLIFGWRFQFGIRSLLAFCLASSIAASWLAVEIEQARRQNEAVKAIGGRHYHDWEFDADGELRANPEPPAPIWLRNLLGVDFFSVVDSISFDTRTWNDRRQKSYFLYTDMTDARLEHLNEFAHLRALNLSCTNITDAGLERLRVLNGPASVGLDDTNITDAGLKCLADLHRLESLSLCDTPVTDAGLEHLKCLTNLTRLNLYNTEITDAGLERLKGLAKLRNLNVERTKVTDFGVLLLQFALPSCKIVH